MPERPGRPSTPGILNDIVARLRALERTRPGFVPPKDDSFIEVWDDGEPQGLVKAIDFSGSGVFARLTGDERAIVEIGGSQTTFDAIVDSTIAASDPDSRLFLGVGEALTYLGPAGLNLNRALVLVRPGTYTETANWTNPARVFLLSATDPFASSNATWDHNGFSGTTNSDYQIMGLQLQTNLAKAAFFQGASSLFRAYGCILDPRGLSAGGTFCAGTIAVYTDCCFRDIANLASGTAAKVYMTNCDVLISQNQTITLVESTGELSCYGLKLGGSGVQIQTWNLPVRALMHLNTGVSRSGGGSAPARITLQRTSAGSLAVYSNCETGVLDVTLSGASWNPVTLVGLFRALTLPAILTGTPGGHIVKADAGTSADITGPALLDLTTTNGTITLRGKRLSGHISTAHGGSSGTAVSLIDADEPRMDIAGTPASSTGTHKPYSFDAASANGVLVFSGRSLYANAGTDAGTNNRVLPEGTTPFTVNGHAIEDEATPLTQRATMNFVGAGVTATDAGGKTVVTIPGGTVAFDNPVESQFGDAMAQGVDADAARADHKHDRHDDAILFLTRMI